MKQILFLLLLFPCLCLAQYTGNANQKITLGEQTTADGLVFRGNAADTMAATLKITKTNKSDTSAFLLLDTINNVFLKYNIGTTFWTRLNILPTDTATMLLPYWRNGRFSGVLPLANGGTNSSTQNFVDLTTTQNVGGAKTFTSALTGTSATFSSSVSATGNITSGNATNSENLFVANGLTFSGLRLQRNSVNTWAIFINNAGTDFFDIYNYATSSSALTINASGNLGIGTTSPVVQLHTTGAVRFAGLASIADLRTDADGNLFNGSDFNLKNSIDSINFGLSDVLKLKPVSFNWNDEARNINEYKSMGFIAQDVMNVIPNAASTMGDGDMQVDYNAIVATLTKAIQEQNALIKALEQRILILENK